MISSKHKVIPVKLKSGHGARLQSIRQFLETHAESEFGIRLSIHNYSVMEEIKSYPLYAVAGIVDNKERILEFLSE